MEADKSGERSDRVNKIRTEGGGELVELLEESLCFARIVRAE